MTMPRIYVYVLALLLVIVAACGRQQEQPAEQPAPEAPVGQPAVPVDEASAATVTGKVNFEGEAPKPGRIQMAADPVCLRLHAQPVTSEEVVVNQNGTLRHVFVYVKSGLEGRTFKAPSDPVVLDQQGCMYKPHVFGIQTGQPLKILNSDPTLHNIHAWTQKNPPFNLGMPNKGMEFTRKFETPEVMVPIKCDVHKWMTAYVGVLNHPYYSVTGEDGTFSLKSLPPGKYLIEAWHEKYGTQTQEITVGPKETKEITFTYKAARA